MARTYRVTLKYPDGTTMFMGTAVAEEIIEIPAKDRISHNGGPPTDSDEPMTDPQRRYLFRLLAAQGVQGKKAEEHLRTYFKVTGLADISRSAASTYIDQLVKDRKDVS
jgi:hypothetical protein